MPGFMSSTKIQIKFSSAKRSNNSSCGRGCGLSEEKEKLKHNKKKALGRFRRGRQLNRKIEQGELQYWWLSRDEQTLLDQLLSGQLGRQVDKAAQEYGFGMARAPDVIPAGQ